MRKFWLIFSQAVTICLAVLFVITTLRPDLVSLSQPNGSVITIREASEKQGNGPATGSLKLVYDQGNEASAASFHG